MLRAQREVLEREIIVRALHACGELQAAAKYLGVNRTDMYRRMGKLAIASPLHVKKSLHRPRITIATQRWLCGRKAEITNESTRTISLAGIASPCSTITLAPMDATDDKHRRLAVNKSSRLRHLPWDDGLGLSGLPYTEQ